MFCLVFINIFPTFLIYIVRNVNKIKIIDKLITLNMEMYFYNDENVRNFVFNN